MGKIVGLGPGEEDTPAALETAVAVVRAVEPAADGSQHHTLVVRLLATLPVGSERIQLAVLGAVAVLAEDMRVGMARHMTALLDALCVLRRPPVVRVAVAERAAALTETLFAVCPVRVEANRLRIAMQLGLG